jgi:hypothetical protein
MKTKFTLTIILIISAQILNAQLSLDYSLLNQVPSTGISKSPILNDNFPDFSNFSTTIRYSPKKVGLALQFQQSKFEPNIEHLNSVASLISFDPGAVSHWDNKLIFLGPIFELGDKLSLKLFPKIGYGFLNAPQKEYFLKSDPSVLIYSERHEGNKNSLFSGIDAKLEFRLIKNISAHLNAGYNTNRFFNETNTTTYRDFSSIQGDISNDLIKNSPLLEKVCNCFELINFGAGITIGFGNPKNKKPPTETSPTKPNKDTAKENKKIEPPTPFYPENEAKISIQEADTLTLEWDKETPSLKSVNYELILYKKGEENEKDSLLYKQKIERNSHHKLPDEIELINGKEYKWQIQAIDNKALKNCPGDCISIQSEFKVASLVVPQYYQLLTTNSGNSVPVGNELLFIVPRNFQGISPLTLRVYKEKKVVALESKNLKEDERVRTTDFERFGINIQKLETNQHYFLEVKGNKRTKYLRFIKEQKESTNETKK